MDDINRIHLLACNAKTGINETNDFVVYSPSKFQTRASVNPNPVKTYSEIVKIFATTDEFKVEVFETKQTFQYL